MPDDPKDSAIPPEALTRVRDQVRQIEQAFSKWRPIGESLSAALEAQSAAIRAAAEAMRPALAAFQWAFEGFADIGLRFQELLRQALPPNWELNGIKIASIETIVAGEAIPLAWVPRKEIVSEVMGASDRRERLSIVVAHRAEIIADCEACLADCVSPGFTEYVALARSVLAAANNGLYEPAQALAVVLAEALITDYVTTGPTAKSYAKASEIAAFTDEVVLAELRRAISIAPVPSFYTKWYPRSGTPAPIELSRHASVHNPSLQQYSMENSLLAMLLLVSLLRQFSEEAAWERSTG